MIQAERKSPDGHLSNTLRILSTNGTIFAPQLSNVMVRTFHPCDKCRNRIDITSPKVLMQLPRLKRCRATSTENISNALHINTILLRNRNSLRSYESGELRWVRVYAMNLWLLLVTKVPLSCIIINFVHDNSSYSPTTAHIIPYFASPSKAAPATNY